MTTDPRQFARPIEEPSDGWPHDRTSDYVNLHHAVLAHSVDTTPLGRDVAGQPSVALVVAGEVALTQAEVYALFVVGEQGAWSIAGALIRAMSDGLGVSQDEGLGRMVAHMATMVREEVNASDE